MLHDVYAQLSLLVSNALLAPVVIALLTLACLSLVYTAGTLAEALVRRRSGARQRRLVDDCTRTKRLPHDALAHTFGLVREGLEALQSAPRARNKIVDDLELRAQRRVERLAIGVRLGPMLGLAGTLIPLGPALLAMANGDLQTLSNRLVVAFGTTVIGLVTGGLSYLLHTIRSGWYEQDLNDLEFLLECMPCDAEDAGGSPHRTSTRSKRLANLFDVGVVFALGFLIALLNYVGVPELLRQDDVTLVKNPGTPQMEIIRKRGKRIERYRLSAKSLAGEGIKLGVAYRLKNGEVVYVPSREAALEPHDAMSSESAEEGR